MPQLLIVQAGKLRHRVTIVTPVLTQDAIGGTHPYIAVPFATVWASIEVAGAREIEHAQTINALVSHKITIRWLEGVKAKQNVWFDNREFQIQAVENPDERRHMLVLLCLERENIVATLVASS